MRIRWSILVAVAVSMAVPRAAEAGPLELLEQFAEGSGDSPRMVLRYLLGGDGLAFSDDGGETWSALCSPAIVPAGWDRAPNALGEMVVDGNGFLYVATFGGLIRDDGTGCSWSSEPAFDDQWVPAVAPHPSDANVLFAAVNYGGTDPESAIYQRAATGIWTEIGTRDSVLVQRVLVTELSAGGLRIYVGGTSGEYGTPPDTRPRYVTRYSDDMGDTWTEFEFGETDGTVVLEAIDPTDPDRVIASLRYGSVQEPSEEPQSALVSTDRGETFDTYVMLSQFGGVDFAPDGRVWIGDRGSSFGTDLVGGLYFAPSLDETPALVEGIPGISCVSYLEGDDVFVCQPFGAGEAGVVSAGTYERRFGFRETQTLHECPGTDVVAACDFTYSGAWCGASHFPCSPMCCAYPGRVDLTEVGCPDACAAVGGTGGDGSAGTMAADAGATGGAGGAAGATTAGTGAGTGGSDDGSDSGCSCALERHTGRGDRGLLGLLLVALVVAWRRRAR